MILSLVIFVIAYFFIATEKIDKTAAAMLGAAAVIFTHQISYEAAFEKIDLNVIFLLMGMMIIIHIVATTGLFEWLAIVSAQKAKGNGVVLLVLLLTITAILSALLDNVTTVIIIAPVTILITQLLEIPTTPFLVLEAIFSNIGGTGTLVGDPPNILIGSQSHLTFNDFLIHLGPIALIIMVIVMLLCIWKLSAKFAVGEKAKTRLAQACPEKAIINPKRLKIALPILCGVFICFLFSHQLGVETGIIAIAGAFIMGLSCKEDLHHSLTKVEWSTILFFAGLFMLVGSLEENGLFDLLGHKVIELTGGNLLYTSLAVLWFSALFSAFLDNIPLVISTIPIIQTIIPIFAAQMGLSPDGEETRVLIAEPLYWSLALGACLGGNGSLIGASANVVVAQISRRNHYPLTFWDFMRYGFPIMIISVILSSVYIVLRYFVLR